MPEVKRPTSIRRPAASSSSGTSSSTSTTRSGEADQEDRKRHLYPLTVAAMKPENAGVGLDPELLQVRPPSHNEHDHSKRLNVDCPRSFHSALVRLVESRKYDFEDVGTFIRTAILVMMDYVERIDPPDYPSNVAVLKFIAEENATTRTRREFVAALDESCYEIMELMAMGLEAEASQHYARIIGHIRSLPKGSGWRRICLKRLTTRFGHIAKMGKIANLTVVDDDELDEDSD